jgi:DNA polymerase IV
MDDPGILHIDMDAFYASVEQRDDPSLLGRPVMVGAIPGGRGVVSAASYEARAFGVRSAMPIGEAYRRCPDGVFLPVRGSHYAAISRQIMAIFHEFTPLVEPISLDEAFLDVRGSVRLFGDAVTIGHSIRGRIREETDLTASVGVAPNKHVAKIASDLEKPDGFVVVRPSEVETFLEDLPIERIWGVGPVAAQRLRGLGLDTIGKLRRASGRSVRGALGRATGVQLMHLARGLDDRDVIPDGVPVSVGHETTFGTDTADREFLEATMLRLTEGVCARMRSRGLAGVTITLKVRFESFETLTRRVTLSDPTDLDVEIFREARRLLRNRVPLDRRKVRLIGISVSGFAEGGERQLDLFECRNRDKMARSTEAVDRIRGRLGRDAIMRAGTLQAGARLPRRLAPGEETDESPSRSPHEPGDRT